MYKLIVIALLCLPNFALAGGLFRRQCNTCYTPCYAPKQTEYQAETKTDSTVVVQNNLFMPQIVNTAFQFNNPAPERGPAPLREFGFQPNMPQYQPFRQLPEVGQPQPQLTQQQLTPFVIQNVIAASSKSTTATTVTTVSNSGQRTSTSDFALEQLNASERLMISWKKGGAKDALKKIEGAGLQIVFQPKASPFVIVTGKLDQARLNALRVDPITTIEPDAQGQK